MNQQNLNEQIAKAEQKNIYLSEVLRSLQEKFSKSKVVAERSSSIEVRGEIQMAQVKNLNKKIEMYQMELEKIKNINTKTVVNQIKNMRDDIRNKEIELNQLSKGLALLEGQTKQMRSQSHGKNKNKMIENMFGQKSYEFQKLQKKLDLLQNIESNRQFKLPVRKNARSSSQMIKEPSVSFTTDKKSKLDQYALYRNLIKFYTQEEEKIKGEIEEILKERAIDESQNEKVKKQIESYQEKIEALRKLKSIAAIK